VSAALKPRFSIFSIPDDGSGFALFPVVKMNVSFCKGDSKVTQHRTGKAQQVAFRSGETVPLSGIWRPEHNGCKNPSELWIRKDELFPGCGQCGLQASFVLLEEVQHISEDSDFRE
jgi:hypothetical protein